MRNIETKEKNGLHYFRERDGKKNVKSRVEKCKGYEARVLFNAAGGMKKDGQTAILCNTIFLMTEKRIIKMC